MISVFKNEKVRFQTIVKMAAKIFREKGYYEANVSEIAKAVGMQKGSLYYYIRSKEELLYTVVMEGLDIYIEALQKLFKSNKQPEILFKEAIIAHMSPIDINFDIYYVFVHQINNLGDKYKKKVHVRIKKYEELWLGIIERGKSQGVFRADLDSKITLFSVIGMCNSTMNWYKPTGKYKIRDIAERYAQMVLMGIRANA